MYKRCSYIYKFINIHNSWLFIKNTPKLGELLQMSNRRTFKNEVGRVVRSATRTCARWVGLSPPKITNDTIGSEADQCMKFARFDQLYKEFKDDRNSIVQTLLQELKSNIDLYEETARSLIANNTLTMNQAQQDDLYNQIQFSFNYAQRLLKSIPDTPRYYHTLKTELRHFIAFLSHLYTTKLLLRMNNNTAFYEVRSTTNRPRIKIHSIPNWSSVNFNENLSNTVSIEHLNKLGNVAYYNSTRRLTRRRRRQ
jgi:hypothetical protein